MISIYTNSSRYDMVAYYEPHSYDEYLKIYAILGIASEDERFVIGLVETPMIIKCHGVIYHDDINCKEDIIVL